MSFATSIRFTRDTASPAVAGLAAGLTPRQLNPVVGRSARNIYRSHLFGVNQTRPNKLGGARTNYFAQAARQTHFTVLDDNHVLVSIPQIGMALRFYGGKVKPVTSKYLTIPAIPEAYGKRASEFPDLKFELLKGRPALVRKEAAVVTQRTRKTSKRTLQGEIKGTAATTSISYGRTVVVFWLKKEVTQKPDPTILPYDEQVMSHVSRDVLDHAHRAWQRGTEGIKS